jgi:hypothetical protein
MKNLRWVPHTLVPTQNTEPATLSVELLRQLWPIEHHCWQFISTLDKSWFYLSADHEQIWLRAEERPSERPRHTIQDPKMMMTIAWNPLGLHLLNALPKGNTFNVEHYRVDILTELFRCPRRLMGGDSLFMLTPQDLTPPENAELFAKKIGSASPYTHPTPLIS